MRRQHYSRWRLHSAADDHRSPCWQISWQISTTPQHLSSCNRQVQVNLALSVSPAPLAFLRRFADVNVRDPRATCWLLMEPVVLRPRQSQAGKLTPAPVCNCCCLTPGTTTCPTAGIRGSPLRPSLGSMLLAATRQVDSVLQTRTKEGSDSSARRVVL